MWHFTFQRVRGSGRADERRAEGWEESVPKWIFEFWDCILRDALHLRCKQPRLLDLPQVMRLTITTCNVLERLANWEVGRPYNFHFLPMIDPLFGHVALKEANENILLVCQFSSKQAEWFDLRCVNVHTGKEYKLLNCKEHIDNIPQNAVFPSQFARLLIEYQRHPGTKSLAPDGTTCLPETEGLLKRAHVIAGDIRYVGKETDRKWEEGEDLSVLDFAPTEYGRTGKVFASEDVKQQIQEIGINRCARESGFDRKNFIRKLVRDLLLNGNRTKRFWDGCRLIHLRTPRPKVNQCHRDFSPTMAGFRIADSPVMIKATVRSFR